MISEPHLLGRREYVQGALLLQFCLESVSSQLNDIGLKDISVKRYKQFQEVDSPVALRAQDFLEPQNTMRASLALQIGTENHQYKLIALPGKLPRYPDTTYKLTDYRELSENIASARVPSLDDFWEVLKEAVQLTKQFHINKYSNRHEFRFVVGGFEYLHFFEPPPDKYIIIQSEISKSMMMKDTLYNQTIITIRCEHMRYSFQMPFLGRTDSR